MIHRILRGVAPVAAMAVGLMATGCNMDVQWDGESKGVPLAELDYEGAAPDTVALLGPDTVVVTNGDTLTIAVEGDDEAVEALRFYLEDDTIGVSRDSDAGKVDGTATVRITMPSPKALMLAGSGGIAAQSMADRAELNLAGSGRIDVASLSASHLDVNVAGSGQIGAAGSADKLELNIMGSGSAEMDELSVGDAEINVMGSGSGTFASDGKVEANIMGSGNVTVYGRADCDINSMGAGSLRCRDAGEAKAAAAE